MSLHESLTPIPPEEHLRRALGARTAQDRLAHAEAGLALFELSEASAEATSIGAIAAPCEDYEEDADTKMLLLRQAYLAHVELHQLRRAVELAEAMVETGVMPDVALHDKSRALLALAELPAAIDAQRLAARRAPATRKSFHLWSLATLQHFAGQHDAALTTLDRALRASTRDRALLKAHAAYVELDRGGVPEALDEVLAELERSPNREGYGRYLAGMIAWHVGDAREAAVHLRAFLRRNAKLDEAKRLTLREELRRARLVLAKIASD